MQFGLYVLLGIVPFIAALAIDMELEGGLAVPIQMLATSMLFFGYPLACVIARRLKRHERAERRAVQVAKLEKAIIRHEAALLGKLARAVTVNEFGAVSRDKTGSVIREFYDAAGINEDDLPYPDAFAIIKERAAKLRGKRRRAGFDADALPSNGIEFEHWVAEGLRQFGWDARVTQGSGDQGLDVIGTRDGLKIGIQCKLHRRAIGNKAVQEAAAGKTFHGTDVAAVLSNAGFTRSAQELAQATDVLLLSPHDIPTLHTKLPLSRQVAAAS